MTGRDGLAVSIVALNHDEREGYDQALLAARMAAYPAGEFAGQEGLMRASEILHLARRAGVGSTTSVLDLCCGVGGPGLLIARHLGCTYRGIDASPAAIRIARRRAGDVDVCFDVARIPPMPGGRFDVVLLLETLLAFPDKAGLFRAIARALPVGGRFAFTLEAGPPLTDAEQALMPDAGTVQLAPLDVVVAQLRAAGLQTYWQQDCSDAHQAVAERLRTQFVKHFDGMAGALGPNAVQALVTTHTRWGEWLRTGRVRKFACAAVKTPRDSAVPTEGDPAVPR